MKFNNTTKTIAYSLLGLWGLYIFIKRGLIGLLLSGSIALIAAAFLPDIEAVAGIVVIGGYLSLVILDRVLGHWEPFMDTPKEITGRLSKISHAPSITVESPSNNGTTGITGVYDSCIEGFEDVSDAKKDKEGDMNSTTGASNTSSPSPAITQALSQLSPQFQQQIANAVQTLTSQQVAAAATPSTGSAQASPSTEKQESPFRSDPAGLFKLGEIPTESREGPIIDAGATFMKALQALDPTQIKSMTEDTAKMVDAQKNLIGLLNTMKPILQDGQKLMSTFTSVLGQPGGMAGTALGQ
jgi:hypothetical protein